MGGTAGTHQGAESETFEEGRMNYYGCILNYPQGWYLSMVWSLAVGPVIIMLVFFIVMRNMIIGIGSIHDVNQPKKLKTKKCRTTEPMAKSANALHSRLVSFRMPPGRSLAIRMELTSQEKPL
jgi:hypothetical protein